MNDYHLPTRKLCERPKRLLLMSRGLARYRLKFTEAVATALDGNVQIIASPSPWNTNLWEVSWNQLTEREGPLLFREVRSVSLQDLLKAVMRRFKSGHEQLSLRNKKLSISEIQPDIIAIHEYSWFMIKLALYARLAGIPCIVFSELGREMPQHGIHRLTRLCHFLFAWLTDVQIANTLGATKPYGARHRPVLFFPYAVDTGEFSVIPKKNAGVEVRLLMVGQYVPRKGADLLLKALKLLTSRSEKKWHLRLVGNQPQDWISGIVKESGLEQFIDLVGVRQGDDLIREYQQADIFILPSRFDTYGVVVHEAASCGLPLLVSFHAGAAHVHVQNGLNGWIIDPEDTKLFAAHLQGLIEDPQLREKMGSESAALARKHCIHLQGKEFALQILKLLQPDGTKSQTSEKSLF